MYHIYIYRYRQLKHGGAAFGFSNPTTGVGLIQVSDTGYLKKVLLGDLLLSQETTGMDRLSFLPEPLMFTSD